MGDETGHQMLAVLSRGSAIGTSATCRVRGRRRILDSLAARSAQKRSLISKLNLVVDYILFVASIEVRRCCYHKCSPPLAD